MVWPGGAGSCSTMLATIVSDAMAMSPAGMSQPPTESVRSAAVAPRSEASANVRMPQESS